MNKVKFKNVFNNISYKMLKKNKMRTAVTIVGIIMATALITAIATFVASLQKSMADYKIWESGNWYGTILAADKNDVDSIKNNKEVNKVFCTYDLGYDNNPVARSEEESGKDTDNDLYDQIPYINIQACDADFNDNLDLHLVSGRLAENANEIILPEGMRKRNEQLYKAGEKISFNTGIRQKNDGSKVSQANHFEDYEKYNKTLQKEENIVNKTLREYTIVGFYDSGSVFFCDGDGPALTAYTKYDPQALQGMACSDINVYFTTKSLAKAELVVSGYKGDGIALTNTALLRLYGAGMASSVSSFIYGMAGIVIILVMGGSVLLIYNSFAMSVSERSRQYGLLSSIGATKRQLRKSVIFEALYVSFIAIPIGIATGIAGIGITLICIRDNIEKMTANMVSIGSLKLYVSWQAVIVAAVAAIITVLISAFIPMIRISKLSASEALKQNNDIKIKKRVVKSSKLVYRIFGFEGMLADKNFKRSRKKYRITVFSLFVSIVLFISATSLVSYMTGALEESYKINDFQLVYSDNVKLKSDAGLIEKIRNLDTVKRAAVVQNERADLTIDGTDITEGYNEFRKEKGLTFEYYPIFAIDDETYRAYLTDNKLDTAEYMSVNEPKFLAYAKYRDRDEKTGQIEVGNVLNKDSISLKASIPDYNVSKDINIAKTVDNLPFCIENTDYYYYGLLIICSQSQYDNYIGKNGKNSYARIYVDTFNHKQAYDDIKKIIEKSGYDCGGNFVDYASEYESQQSMMFIIKVFSYGFIAMLSLIAMANVFNTVSTNLLLRRREFAMLKAVGLTPKGFNKMMYYECIMYGCKSLLFGIPVSILTTLWIYKVTRDAMSVSFKLPWAAMSIACISVFLIVFITMIYSKSKINKMNLIETIKNENI